MSDWLGALIGAVERTAWQLAKHKRPKRNPIQQIVLQAKQAGIHPLVAIQGGFTGAPLYGSEGIPSGFSTGLGEAIGGFGDYMLEQRENQMGELDYDRRRAEDRMFQREMNQRDPLNDKFMQAQIGLMEAQRARIMNELDSASKGATQGGNSWPLPPRAFDVPGVGRVIPSSPGLNQELQPHYGEGADLLTAPAAIDDSMRASDRFKKQEVRGAEEAVDSWVEDKILQILKQLGL